MRQLVPALRDAAKELSSAMIASPIWSGRRQDIFNAAPAQPVEASLANPATGTRL
jgi:hypothetical protein